MQCKNTSEVSSWTLSISFSKHGLKLSIGEREAVERARGDREEEETPRMRKLELEEMADAKRDPANRQGDEKK
jgi:hypothetical protein